MEQGLLQNLEPCRYVSFLFPHPLKSEEAHHLNISVLDSPLINNNGDGDGDGDASTAAMLVPKGRELDWIFSTQAGHFQLLFSAKVSRLILIARKPLQPEQQISKITTKPSQSEHEIPAIVTKPSSPWLYEIATNNEAEELQKALAPLLLALCPRISFGLGGGLPFVPFLSYIDNVVFQNVLEQISSPITGGILVEDVALSLDEIGQQVERKKWHRRLRFSRMPNLVQTEMALLANGGGVDPSKLVHPYLGPIVAGLVLLEEAVADCVNGSVRPKLLALGVGGGALLTFLDLNFEFSISAVELDETVLMLAERYFGLRQNSYLRVRIADAVKVVREIASRAVFSGCVAQDLARAWRNRRELDYNFEESERNCIKNDDSGESSRNCINNDIFEESSRTCDNNGVQQPCSVDGNSEKNVLPQAGQHEQGFQNLVPGTDQRVHVIVLDIDADNPQTGICAPPVDFFDEGFLLACRLILHDSGILIVNVVPPDNCFYDSLVSALAAFFLDLYEIKVNDGENYVLFACASRRVAGSGASAFAEKVSSVLAGEYIDQLRKIM